MFNRCRLKGVIFLLTVCLTAVLSNGQKINKNLSFFGDIRMRVENDWNSQKTDGNYRKDRLRMRYRLRFGFKYKWYENVEFGGRLRSGNPLNQQSPHVTFGNEFEASSLSIDKAFLKYKKKSFWLWGGKNSFPFWRQNELFWDDDVNPEGIALGKTIKLPNKNLKLKTVTGYFVPDNTGQIGNSKAYLLAAQLNLINLNKQFSYTLSSGLFLFRNLPNTPDRTNTFLLDYSIFTTDLQFKFKNKPFSFGVGYYRNLENYEKNRNINTVFKNQKTAYVFNINYGKSKKRGDILIGYYYASIAKYAVVDYFAQDDWVRWGTNNYTQSSNFRGSELRFKYTFGTNYNLVLRSYFVKGIKTTTTILESGNRVRLDFNIKF